MSGVMGLLLIETFVEQRIMFSVSFEDQFLLIAQTFLIALCLANDFDSNANNE